MLQGHPFFVFHSQQSEEWFLELYPMNHGLIFAVNSNDHMKVVLFAGGLDRNDGLLELGDAPPMHDM